MLQIWCCIINHWQFQKIKDDKCNKCIYRFLLYTCLLIWSNRGKRIAHFYHKMTNPQDLHEYKIYHSKSNPSKPAFSTFLHNNETNLVGNVGDMSATCRRHDRMLWVQTLVAMSFFDVSFYFYVRVWYVTSACRRRHAKCPVLSAKKTVSGHRTFPTKETNIPLP